ERGRPVPLRWHVVPDVGFHIGIDFAGDFDGPGELALRDAGLRIAVGTERREIVRASDRLAVDDPGVFVRRPGIESALHYPQGARLERGNGCLAIDLERRTLV